MESDYLTTAEVAQMFRVTTTTVTRWCNNGKYPRKYLMRTNGDAKGSKWLIHKDALKSTLKQLKAHSTVAEDERIQKVVAKGRELLQRL